MSNLKFSVPDLAELKPRITVFGVGGGGCNAVNNMIESNLTGVEFVVANTDAQALAKSPCERKIQMGNALTQGLGAGSRPEIGAGAAEEALAEIVDHLAGAHMAFITAGMGGGTGTGAAPVIAKAAKEQGILTVAVVTKPFHFEGRRRMAIAEKGIENLSRHVDTLIVIPNQNLFRVANEKTSFTAAFAMADQVLYSGVASITELMTKEGLINLDFADVRAVMADMGKAMMGTGEASGERRAVESAEAAISNPLLDDVSLTGARGVLISIAGGPDLTLYEVDEAANRIREEVDDEANIIVGATIEEELEGTMRVSVVATGLQEEDMAARPPAEDMAQESRRIHPVAGLSNQLYTENTLGGSMERHMPASTDAGNGAKAQPAAIRDAAHARQPDLPLDADAGTGAETSSSADTSVAQTEAPAASEAEEHLQRAHIPAPTAPPRPEPRTTTEATNGGQSAAPSSVPNSTLEKVEQLDHIIGDRKRTKERSSLLQKLTRLGRSMTGRGSDAPEHHDHDAEPKLKADNVHRLDPSARESKIQTSAETTTAATNATTTASATGTDMLEEDELAIPTFLRKQQN